MWNTNRSLNRKYTKLLLNSLYAKYAQGAAITVLVPTTVAEHDLYEYERDPDSGALCITVKTVARSELSK